MPLATLDPSAHPPFHACLSGSAVMASKNSPVWPTRSLKDLRCGFHAPIDHQRRPCAPSLTMHHMTHASDDVHPPVTPPLELDFTTVYPCLTHSVVTFRPWRAHKVAGTASLWVQLEQ